MNIQYLNADINGLPDDVKSKLEILSKISIKVDEYLKTILRDKIKEYQNNIDTINKLKETLVNNRLEIQKLSPSKQVKKSSE